MAVKKRNRDRVREEALDYVGKELVQHTSEAAVKEAEERALDNMFVTDSSHDVEMTVGRVKCRIVVDCELLWDEPPHQSPERAMETLRSFLLKSLTQHKYFQFGAVVSRVERSDDQ